VIPITRVLLGQLDNDIDTKHCGVCAWGVQVFAHSTPILKHYRPDARPKAILPDLAALVWSACQVRHGWCGVDLGNGLKCSAVGSGHMYTEQLPTATCYTHSYTHSLTCPDDWPCSSGGVSIHMLHTFLHPLFDLPRRLAV
jgi:hypothetical protein